MDESVEVLSDSVELAEYRPRLLVTPDQAKSLVEGVAEIARSILIEDVDYGLIPGVKKPSLWKPGAEKLLGYFGFGHHFADAPLVERDDAGGFVGVTYRCIVTKPTADGEVVVASCDGYAGRDEQKWKSAPRNTVVKMAQKRALVGACLQATATSGLFAQDVEDYDEPERSPASGNRLGPPPSEKQANYMAALISEKLPAEPSRVREIISSIVGRQINSRTELTGRECSKVIDALKNAAPGQYGEDVASPCEYCSSDPCECAPPTQD